MIGFWLSALTRPKRDLTLGTHAGLSTRIAERPTGLTAAAARFD